ncbi:MAG: rhodanese-like domain-containing protein [Flavobacteriales bacterium]|nr:rhodanese-like domain-containing protein [Flavobacteriales bacterium]
MGLLSKLFGPKVDYAALVKSGAMILDVRTPEEFKRGHIKGAVNIPLQTLHNQFNRLNKEKTIITCCASGMRSASAKSMLKSAGFQDVHNGGGWMSLNEKI